MTSSIGRICHNLFRCITNIPVIFILGLILWSFYVINLIVCTGEYSSMISILLLFLIFYPSTALLLWSYLKSVCTNSLSIPSMYRLSVYESEQLIDLDQGPDRSALLERIVSQKALPNQLTVNQGGVPFCRICFLIKPDRCHHCSTCFKCVSKMDHHCPWINNCVGYHNQKYFILFLMYTVLYCMFCIFISGVIVNAYFQKGKYFSITNFQIFFVFILAIVFAIATTGLFLFQLLLVFQNATTIEYFRKPRFRLHHCHMTFNLGWRENWLQVFGNDPKYWFLPVFSSKGDGLSYAVRTPVLSDDRVTLLGNFEERL